MSALNNALYIIGALTASYYVYHLLIFIQVHTRTSRLERYMSKDKPSWALVTGASDGIGFGLAQELCARGFNVILHGRNRSKLESKKKELESQFPGRQIALAVAEASNSSPEVIEAVKAAVGDKNLKVVINNLAVSRIHQRIYKPLEDLERTEIEAVINSNLRFFTQLNAALYPVLKRNAPGLVMSLGSLGGRFPQPYIQLYSATKSYQLAWSAAMAWETKAEGHDVEVLGIQVGQVNSAGNPQDEGLGVPSSRKMADAALNKVGCGYKEVCGYWVHALQAGFVGILPDSVQATLMKHSIGELKMKEDKELKGR